ncbi:MAG: hypothetical protein AB7Q42_16295 [Acidimicrobiia bacterium]
MNERWTELLDAYERTLEQHRAHLEAVASGVHGTELPAPPAPFTPPAGLSPLPPELGERAAALVETTQQLSRVARELLAQMSPPPVMRPTAPSSTSATRFDRGI